MKTSKVRRIAGQLGVLVALIVLGALTSKVQASNDPLPFDIKFYLMIKTGPDRLNWQNLGGFATKKSCDWAGYNMMKIPRHAFVCTPVK